MTTTESVAATRARSGQPVRVGIIGLGAREDFWACLAHLPALRAVPGFEVTALSTSSPESAARSGEIHGVARTFGNGTDLAACDEVDLVVVSVRVPKHRELVSAALQAGKAVYCEWPLGNGLAETEELARLAGEHDVPTIVGLQIRANPVMNYLRDLVADGYVGEVLSTTVIGSAGGIWGRTATRTVAICLTPRTAQRCSRFRSATLLMGWHGCSANLSGCTLNTQSADTRSPRPRRDSHWS
jgi:predicted dehydrogenase